MLRTVFFLESITKIKCVFKYYILILSFCVKDFYIFTLKIKTVLVNKN
jgi:hypothetical protein